MTEPDMPIALVINDIPIDEHCIGDRWQVGDINQLAKLVAIIVMGQATHAACILRELTAAAPAFTNESLQNEAIIKLTVQEKKQSPRIGYPRWQRDGLIFETISWIAARQQYGADVFLKDPHVSATTQGLDGLMIEMEPGGLGITQTTIFEDKCSEDPRGTFIDKVIPAFLDRHENKRSAELIASAASLIKLSGIDDEAAIRAAERVLDIKFRRYRASMAVTSEFDTDEQRKVLFSGYDALSGIEAAQRVGASFVVDGELRDWFDAFAEQAVEFLTTLDGMSADV